MGFLADSHTEHVEAFEAIAFVRLATVHMYLSRVIHTTRVP